MTPTTTSRGDVLLEREDELTQIQRVIKRGGGVLLIEGRLPI